MHIAVLHNAVDSAAALDDQDVLVQVEAVSAALEALGHRTTAVPCTLDLHSFRLRIEELAPDLAFNLVEGLEGWDSLSSLAPSLLDALAVPYTGNSTEATFLTTQKVLAKQQMRQAGLPTPDWLIGEQPPALVARSDASSDDRWIIKGLWDQASRNLDDDAIVAGDEAQVRRCLIAWHARHGRRAYAERFVAGREFNVAMLTSPDGPIVLPPAEIDFSAFPPDKPRIVGYRAKWIADSFEYNNTPRRFDFPAEDERLLAQLRELAAACWDVFGLRGYVRVDFRVDRDGQPWILEVNTNPCLSPDAGFAAALQRRGIAFPAAIEAIVDEAQRRFHCSTPNTV
jgi:D-alanine-D-alanine ligase